MASRFPSSLALLFCVLLWPLPVAGQGPGKRMNEHGEPIPKGATAVLGTNRFRHADAAYLAVEPDGKTFITIGHCWIHVWDTATGKPLGTRQLPDAIASGALSPDGKTLANSRVQTVIVWNVDSKINGSASGGLRYTVDMPPNVVPMKLLFSQEGTTLAWKEFDPVVGSQVVLMDVVTGKRKVVTAVKQPFYDYALAPDGKRVYVTTKETLSCWDAAGKEVWKTPADAVFIVLSPDGKTLLTFPDQADEPVSLWDAATGKKIGPKLPVLTFPWPNAAAFSPDGKHVAVNTQKGLELLDVTTGKIVHRWPDGANCFAFTPDSKTLLCCNGVLQAHDVASGKALYPHARAWGHSHSVDQMVWSPDGKRLASGANGDPSIFVWDVAAAKLVCRTSGPYRWLWSFGFAAGGKELVGAEPPHDLWVWDSFTGKPKSKTTLMENGKKASFGKPFYMLPMFSRDGTRIVEQQLCGERWEKIKYRGREVPGGKLFADLELPRDQCGLFPGFTPEALLTMDEEGRFRDLLTGRMSPALECPTNLTYASVVFCSPDGFLALAMLAPPPSQLHVPEFPAVQLVGLWERATGRLVRTWAPADLPFFTRAAFGPDARTLCVRIDNKLQLRDLATDSILRWIPIGPVSAVSYSPDGRWVATTTGDCTITLWDLRGAKAKQPKPPPPPNKEEIERFWTDLVEADAAKGVRAVWRLIDAGEQVLAILGDRIPPVTPLPKDEIAALLRDLDSDVFKTREAAAKRLRELGEIAAPALRAKLQAKPSLEVRKRIELVLEPLVPGRPPKGEPLRAIRAVHIAERIGTAAAIRLLAEWAKGAEGAPLTEAATAALARWKYANPNN
jgi:WD40 repeat protein